MENWGLRQEIALSTGTSYKVTFTAKQLTGEGEMYSGLGYTAVPFFNQVITSSFVTYTYYQSPTNVTAPYDTVYFGGKLATGAEVENTFEIKDVLVEPLGVDWTVRMSDLSPTTSLKYVEFVEAGARFVSDVSGTPYLYLEQSTLSTGKLYKFICSVAYTGTGKIKAQVGGYETASLEEGLNTIYTGSISTNTVLRFLRNNANVDCIISNISVQELDSPQIKIGSGALTLPKLGQGDNAQTITDSASIEFYFLRGGGDVDYNADITDVTVRETGMNWVTYGSQVNFYNGYTELVIDSSNTNVGIYQENVFQSGVKYRVDVTMKATAPFDAEIVESNAASTITNIGTPSLTTEYQDFTYYFTGTGSYDLFIHRLSTASSANQNYIYQVCVCKTNV